MERASKAWIFVSHSTRDLDKVRQVRNAIEAAGGEPVLFFLKCLSDHDEIDDLIKREIESRNFFLLCDSSHAKSSKWVQDEITHVKKLQGKIIKVIDLDADWQSQIDGIQSVVEQATVFMSYAHKDEEAIAPVRSALMANDFSVWTPTHDIVGQESFADQISSAIEGAVKFGYVLHFISQKSLQSEWVKREVEYAFGLGIGDRYIPILLDPPTMIADLIPRDIAERQWLDYSERNLATLLPQLFRILGVRNTEQV